VTFSECKGMTQLNGTKHTLKLIDSYSFSIDLDAKTFPRYEGGGYATQVKKPVTMSFVSLFLLIV
jgi:ubiquitin-activating enzyme E1